MFNLLPEGARDAISNMISVLSNRGIWIRFGTTLAGIALMWIGVVILLRGSIVKGAGTVAKAVI